MPITRKDLKKIYREWDKQRQNAVGPNDLAEIDAIFSREIQKMETTDDRMR